MTLTMFWIICVVISATLMLLGSWLTIRLARRNPNSLPEAKQFTLKELMAIVFIAVIPVVNFFIIFGLLFYIFQEIAPKIVLFGKEK